MATLIDKLRAAETGSPELSAEVLTVIFPEYVWLFGDPDLNIDSVGICRTHENKQSFAGVKMPDVTQSIDAALTLVPEYKQLVLNHWKDQWRVDFYDDNNIAVKHKSLPIAICIAALRARE